MNTKIVKQLVKIANILDANGYHNEADTLTKVAQTSDYTEPFVAKLRDALNEAKVSTFYLGNVTDSESTLHRTKNVFRVLGVGDGKSLYIDTKKAKEILNNPVTLNRFNREFALSRIGFLSNRLNDPSLKPEEKDAVLRELMKLKKFTGKESLGLGDTAPANSMVSRDQRNEANRVLSNIVVKNLKKDPNFADSFLGGKNATDEQYYASLLPNAKIPAYGNLNTGMLSSIEQDIKSIKDENLRKQVGNLFIEKRGKYAPGYILK